MGKSGTCALCGTYIQNSSYTRCKKGGGRTGFCCKYLGKCLKGCESGKPCQKMCKRDMKCSRVDCQFEHSENWNPIHNQKPCRDGSACHRKDCYKFFSHPQPIQIQAPIQIPIQIQAPIPIVPFVFNKQIWGNTIYNKVVLFAGGQSAGKITGMFLELPDLEIIHLATNDDALILKIQEAYAVLQNYNHNISVKV